jgi:hypothetical protein
MRIGKKKDRKESDCGACRWREDKKGPTVECNLFLYRVVVSPGTKGC